MSEIDHTDQEKRDLAIFNGIGNFFDQNKKPLLEEYRETDKGQAGFYMVFGGIRMQYGNLTAHQQLNTYVKHKTGYVQLRVALNKSNTFTIDHVRYELNAQEYNLIYISAKEALGNYQEEEGETDLFKIDLQANLFFKYCPPIKSSFEIFREQVQSDKTAILSVVGLPLSNEMRSVIFDMLHCSKPIHFRHIYLKAKVVELLTLQLEHCDQLQHLLKSSTLKEEEMQRIFTVKKILEEQFYLDHTLLSLARTVGTNDATLKKHFKAAFGVTVFSYLTKVRMQYAKKLLIDSKEKIQNIAGSVGYKHATHFTAAFKKYFGYLPTKIRVVWIALFVDISTIATEAEWLLSV